MGERHVRCGEGHSSDPGWAESPRVRVCPEASASAGSGVRLCDLPPLGFCILTALSRESCEEWASLPLQSLTCGDCGAPGWVGKETWVASGLEKRRLSVF